MALDGTLNGLPCDVSVGGSAGVEVVISVSLSEVVISVSLSEVVISVSLSEVVIVL